MKLKKGEIVEMDMTISVDGEVVESSDKQYEGNPELLFHTKPFLFQIGDKAYPQGLTDHFLNNNIKLNTLFDIKIPEAYGPHDPKLVQTLVPQVATKLLAKGNSLKVGSIICMTGREGFITKIHRSRVVVDFNRIFAGKTIAYSIKILRKVTEPEEIIRLALDMLLPKREPSDIIFSYADNNLTLEYDSHISTAPSWMMFKYQLVAMIRAALPIPKIIFIESHTLDSPSKE